MADRSTVPFNQLGKYQGIFNEDLYFFVLVGGFFGADQDALSCLRS